MDVVGNKDRARTGTRGEIMPTQGECRAEVYWYLRYQVIQPWLLKHEVHMGWPPWMALKPAQQLAYRAVIRDGIAYGPDGLEPEAAVHVAGHNAPLAWRLSIGILHVIVA